MRAVSFAVLIGTALVVAPWCGVAQEAGGPQSGQSGSQAQTLASIGNNDLHLGRLADAQTNCDAALKLDPSNVLAKACLDAAARMLVDQDLNDAGAKLLQNKKSDAVALASKWVYSAPQPQQQERAREIMKAASSMSLHDFFVTITPSWFRQTLLAIGIVVGCALLLLGARKLWRLWQRGKWYGDRGKTSWRMLPLKEVSVADESRTGVPTDAVLDALARLGHELARELWQPKLLLLRPTPPAEYEPAVISEFLSSDLPLLVLVPAAEGLSLEWKLHEIQLDQAVENLQLRTSAGLDIGSVARFVRSVFNWFNSGSPVISGVAEVSADKSAAIHLAARGGPIQSVAVGAVTEMAPGLDTIQLSAERAAFKFLLRMRYPAMTNDEIDGFSALRQGAIQFAQYAGTVPLAGDDAVVRTSTLAKAALNLGFFRASIPSHCVLPASAGRPRLEITDEVRQAVLLAEGVAHCLVGTDQDSMAAIDCFRQLEDWPAQTDELRQQAAYNEAVVWRQLGYEGRCVLMLTELLGEKAPDTVLADDAKNLVQEKRLPLSAPVSLLARLARLAAFAEYDRDDWIALPRSRAKLLLDDGERLIQDLQSITNQENTSSHDRRIANYLYVEALRALGHVELLNIVTGEAASLYHDKRPTGLKDGALSKEGTEHLNHAINWMRRCEELAPSCGLFSDLAEAFLLLKNFTAAEGYARHATLERDPSDKREDSQSYERAYYLAAESFYLENTENSLALARKYALDFKGMVQLEEFKAVRADLGIIDGQAAKAAAQGPASPAPQPPS